MEQTGNIINILREEEYLDNYLYIKLLAKSENEKLARNIVASFMIEVNPSVELLSDIKTAVSEAVTNSIVHGYKENKGEFITLTLKLKGNNFYISIEDNGVGIPDIEKAMQPFYTTGKEGERSGMGFTVMETFMDDIMVSNKINGGVRVEMVKTIKEGE